jgi:hypothetical protein
MNENMVSIIEDLKEIEEMTKRAEREALPIIDSLTICQIKQSLKISEFDISASYCM